MNVVMWMFLLLLHGDNITIGSQLTAGELVKKMKKHVNMLLNTMIDAL